jgi:tetratricopeptide (TPR) repeat protein
MRRARFVDHALVTVACLALGAAIALGAAAVTPGVPLTTSSKEALALFQQGRDAVDNLELSRAEMLLEQATQKDPGFAMAHLYRAMAGGPLETRRRSLAEAARLSDKVTPGEREWILAVRDWDAGNPTSSGAHIDALLRLHPSDKWAQLLAANYQAFVVQDLPAALVAYRKATEIDKGFAAAYNLIGYAQARLGNNAEAEQAFKQYIALLPGRPNPYDSYGEFLLKLGRYEDSIAQYEIAFEKDPRFVSALEGIGHNRVMQGNYAAARESYERAFERAPGVGAKIGALHWTAVSFVHEGKVDEAVKAFDEASAFAEAQRQLPAAVNAQLDAAFVLGEMGRLADAVHQLDRTQLRLDELELAPSDRDALRFRMLLTRAHALLPVHQFDAARALVEQARAIADAHQSAPQQRAAEAILGELEIEAGRADAALAHLAKADQEAPYNWFSASLALDLKAATVAAREKAQKVAGWNWNDLSFALVRTRAVARAKQS